jgi:hypothetical protein
VVGGDTVLGLQEIGWGEVDGVWLAVTVVAADAERGDPVVFGHDMGAPASPSGMAPTPGLGAWLVRISVS